MLPDQQRALVLNTYAGVEAVVVEERPVPPPRRDEVLVRVAAAPIHPADIAFLWGGYQFRRALPCIPGLEGSGTIVAVGEGVDASRIGQRVACFCGEDDDGTWAQYIRVQAEHCLPIEPGVDLEQAALLIANPVTVWALFDLVGSTPAIIQTASASALGQMVIRLAQRRGIELLNLIRHDEQNGLLRELGAKHILNVNATDFDERLRQWAQDSGARVVFDAVAGELGGRILRLMPDHSRIIFYSKMSGTDVPVEVVDLIFNAKTIEGFWINWWIAENPGKLATAWHEIQAQLDIFQTEIRARHSLEEAAQAINEYAAQMKGGKGKMLLTP